jgi:hypothetical protein
VRALTAEHYLTAFTVGRRAFCKRSQLMQSPDWKLPRPVAMELAGFLYHIIGGDDYISY